MSEPSSVAVMVMPKPEVVMSLTVPSSVAICSSTGDGSAPGMTMMTTLRVPVASRSPDCSLYAGWYRPTQRTIGSDVTYARWSGLRQAITAYCGR